MPDAEPAVAREMTRNLAPLLQAAREVHPRLVVDEVAFTGFLAGLLPAEASPEDLLALHTTDLYLAFACSAREPASVGRSASTPRPLSAPAPG